MTKFDTASLLSTNPWAEQLRAMGIEVPDEPYSDERLGVVPPSGTEVVIDRATDEEARLYSALVDANILGERIFTNLLASETTRMAENLAKAATFREAMEATASNKSVHFPEELWEARHRYSLIHAMLWWMVGRRLGHHAAHLGFRTNRQIVVIGRRK